MLSLRRLLKQYRWFLLPSLALITLSAVLVIAHSLSQPPPEVKQVTLFEPSPTATPHAIASAPAIAPIPKPTASLLPTPSRSPQPVAKAPPKNLGGKPQLTAAEQEMNRRAREQFQAAASSVDAVIEMHVAIAKGVSSLNVGASTNALVADQQGKALGQLEAKQLYTAQTDGGSISLGASQFPETVWIDPGPTGLLYVNDRPYRGRLLLVVNQGTLAAVNYINLRKYLHSVVASEVSPSWHPDALKAQAIAARSYALTYYFRPASSFFHLGNDEYYQVYSGIEREAPETNQAVDATAGEFVSYRGGIVESLYAASDDIVSEAFQGRGMSQLGALDLANQGYTYQQILSHYYPGTGVGRIALDQE